MNKEIKIPEGYEARIEGNKVVFISKESEDERIRKELIEFIKSLLCNDAFNRYKLGSWITWLEKQKEQKPAEWSEEDEAIYTAFVCEVINEKMNPTPEQVKWIRSLRDRLKSLCPQPHWKPSEEQMKTLKRTIRLANFGLEKDRRKSLESLYEQLKNL